MCVKTFPTMSRPQEVWSNHTLSPWWVFNMWWCHWKVVKGGGNKLMEMGHWRFSLGVGFCSASFCTPISLIPRHHKVTRYSPPWWTRAGNRNKSSCPKHSEEKNNWAEKAERCQKAIGRWVGRGEMCGAQLARIRWYHHTSHLAKQHTLPPLLYQAWRHLEWCPSFCLPSPPSDMLLDYSSNVLCILQVTKYGKHSTS